MTKINIINSQEDMLDSYKNMSIAEAKELTNGTCSEIICTILDKMTFSDRVEAVHILSKKIANLGLITLKFFNATKLCKDLIKGNINGQFLSKIISENKSLCIESDMMEILAQTKNINIQKIYNDNQHIVLVLQKKV